jgi:hypothetical protein
VDPSHWKSAVTPHSPYPCPSARSVVKPCVP